MSKRVKSTNIKATRIGLTFTGGVSIGDVKITAEPGEPFTLNLVINTEEEHAFKGNKHDLPESTLEDLKGTFYAFAHVLEHASRAIDTAGAHDALHAALAGIPEETIARLVNSDDIPEIVRVAVRKWWAGAQATEGATGGGGCGCGGSSGEPVDDDETIDGDEMIDGDEPVDGDEMIEAGYETHPWPHTREARPLFDDGDAFDEA
jgi:hypothetical protein